MRAAGHGRGNVLGILEIAAGMSHTCFLLSSGDVQCCGYNADGELGDGTTSERHVLSSVTGLSPGVVAITAGSQHNCALLSSGGIECWGYNAWGQLGDGSGGWVTPTVMQLVPVKVFGSARR
jgi:alpha-tubulin suppressor-like RCC1 family protein